MIYISGFGEADNRMQQQCAVDLFSGPLRNLLVSPMQWVTSLKRDHMNVAQLLQTCARFGWGQTELAKIIAMWQGKHAHWPGNVNWSPAIHFRNQRMSHIFGTKDLSGELGPIPLVDLRDGYDRQQLVLRISESYFLVQSDAWTMIDS